MYLSTDSALVILDSLTTHSQILCGDVFQFYISSIALVLHFNFIFC